MLAALLALGTVGGLVLLAWRGVSTEHLSVAFQKKKLVTLAQKPTAKLTLDEAEDGLVLARRFKQKELAKKFATIVADKRKRRVAV